MGFRLPGDSREYDVLTESTGDDIARVLVFICSNVDSDGMRRPLLEIASSTNIRKQRIPTEDGSSDGREVEGTAPGTTFDHILGPPITEIHIERPTFERVQVNVRVPHKRIETASAEDWEDGLPIESSLDCPLDHNLYQNEEEQVIELGEVDERCERFVDDILSIVNLVERVRGDGEPTLTLSNDGFSGVYCHDGVVTFSTSIYLEDKTGDSISGISITE